MVWYGKYVMGGKDVTGIFDQIHFCRYIKQNLYKLNHSILLPQYLKQKYHPDKATYFVIVSNMKYGGGSIWQRETFNA